MTFDEIIERAKRERLFDTRQGTFLFIGMFMAYLHGIAGNMEDAGANLSIAAPREVEGNEKIFSSIISFHIPEE